MKIVKITAGNVITTAEINEKDILHELQNHVGGLIETVKPRYLYTLPGVELNTLMLVDEEGLLKHKHVNEYATWLYGYHSIVGDVIFCKEIMKDDGPDITGLTDDEAEKLLAILTYKFKMEV